MSARSARRPGSQPGCSAKAPACGLAALAAAAARAGRTLSRALGSPPPRLPSSPTPPPAARSAFAFPTSRRLSGAGAAARPEGRTRVRPARVELARRRVRGPRRHGERGGDDGGVRGERARRVGARRGGLPRSKSGGHAALPLAATCAAVERVPPHVALLPTADVGQRTRRAGAARAPVPAAAPPPARCVHGQRGRRLPVAFVGHASNNKATTPPLGWCAAAPSRLIEARPSARMRGGRRPLSASCPLPRLLASQVSDVRATPRAGAVRKCSKVVSAPLLASGERERRASPGARSSRAHSRLTPLRVLWGRTRAVALRHLAQAHNLAAISPQGRARRLCAARSRCRRPGPRGHHGPRKPRGRSAVRRVHPWRALCAQATVPLSAWDRRTTVRTG